MVILLYDVSSKMWRKERGYVFPQDNSMVIGDTRERNEKYVMSLNHRIRALQ